MTETPTEDTRIFLRRRDAAHDLSISESQLMRWERAGFITPLRVPGIRSVRYHVTEVRSLAQRILNGNLERDPSEVA